MEIVMGRVHSVESFGTVDGPGIRYVLFLQGCPLRCVYCHNPDSWNVNGGKETSSVAVVQDILRYKRFIRRGGVTLSGGEPLLQPDFVAAILDGCRENELHTALDTSGGVPLSLCREAIEKANLLLLDIKAAESALFHAMTGQSRDNTLAVLQLCEAIHKPVWIRHVLVPGLTLEETPLRALGTLLRPYTCIEKVELLPFHKMGEYKWTQLGQRYSLMDTPAPSGKQVEEAEKLLTEYGLRI